VFSFANFKTALALEVQMLSNFKYAFLITILFTSLVHAETYRLDKETIDQYISVIDNEKNWELDIFKEKFNINSSDPLFQKVELLGAVRCDDERVCAALANKMKKNVSVFQTRFREYFVEIALIRIDEPAIKATMENLGEAPYYGILTLTPIMPYDSALELIKLHRSQNKHNPAIVNGMNELERRIKDERDRPRERQLPSLHDSTLNHPLYKARQSTIETNLELAQQILKTSKNLTSIDGESKVKLLTAIEELGRVRAVEAVEVLAPILLLQADKEISGLDKKYISLQKYPVGVALAKIGIPSIWGLLEEVTKRSDNNDEYRKVACDVMTTILIAKAIPGFVNETLDKHKDNELAQIRLAKLLPLLGKDATKIELLKPQFRNWQSADNLFESRAKFISLDKKNDVTLEKENGKQTTIEFSALSLKDQNYIKEITSTIAKNTQ
jgi:hypothetical protein